MTKRSIKITELDGAVDAALKSLGDQLTRKDWSGRREREVVSMFCFSHLLNQVGCNRALYDPGQIAIEVAVPQNPDQVELTNRSKQKPQVCKDIVLWDKPADTCWDANGLPSKRPMCIIEWKHNVACFSSYDVKWLSDFSKGDPDFVGYAVLTVAKNSGISLSCTRVYLGESEPGWLNV